MDDPNLSSFPSTVIIESCLCMSTMCSSAHVVVIADKSELSK